MPRLCRAVMAVAIVAVIAPASSCAVAADAARGRELYDARCSGCHSIDADRIGPRHRGVVGRKAGGIGGFEYSPALHDSTIVWTPVTLDRWLTDPEKLIPGQRMNISVAEAADRADLIAFLATTR